MFLRLKGERGKGLQVVGKVRAKSQKSDFDVGQDITALPDVMRYSSSN